MNFQIFLEKKCYIQKAQYLYDWNLGLPAISGEDTLNSKNFADEQEEGSPVRHGSSLEGIGCLVTLRAVSITSFSVKTLFLKGQTQ